MLVCKWAGIAQALFKLVGFDTPENLEKRLLAPNEIVVIAEAQVEEIKEILTDISHITEIDAEEKDGDFTVANIKTDHDNIYDIFIELSEGRKNNTDASQDTRIFRIWQKMLLLTAYVFGAFLLAFVGIGAMLYNIQAAVSNFEFVLSFGCLIFVVIVPILTMRVIAEERKQKTQHR